MCVGGGGGGGLSDYGEQISTLIFVMRFQYSP